MKARIFLALATVALSGCATAYQPKGFSGGYSEIRMNDNTYSINVAGNGFTDRDRARSIAMLRASELTMKAGFERFAIVSGGVESKYAGSTPVSTTVIGHTAYTDGGEPIVKPEADYVIRMLHPNDQGFADAFDAKLIFSQLRPQFPDKSS